MAQDDSLGSLLRICIALLCVGAAVLIVVILSSDRPGDESGKALGTAVALAFLSLVAMAGANLADRQPGIAAVGYLTILVAGIALALTAKLIWADDWLSSSDAARWTWYSLIGAFALGNSSALLAGHDDDDADAVKLVRVGTVLVSWALVVAAIAEIRQSGLDVDPQLMGVIAVVYGLGILVLPLLRRVAD